jgi:excisionase family DNA binding protein
VTKRKRTYNLRLIRATWPYTVQEVAALLQVHKGAVLRWLNEGLRADQSRRPFLIRGDELVRFLSERQQARKRKCRVQEFFCFKCRAPSTIYLNIVDIVIESASRFRMKALCADCGTPVNKMQAISNLEKIKSVFHVQELAGQHLIERAAANANSDLEGVS